jgi:hypothetical protein
MVRLMLCRCIRISAQVSEVDVVPASAPLCLKIVAAWAQYANWNPPLMDDNITYHMVQLGSSPFYVSGESSETLYYAMKNVR